MRPLVAGGQSDRKRNRAKFTQFPMNSFAVSCSSSSSKLLSRFQTRVRGRARGRARFKYSSSGVNIKVVSPEHRHWPRAPSRIKEKKLVKIRAQRTRL
ncbi:hypothetical protein D1AOALGA4SA_2365 [Olavius algarvensis Delta 1 endosymbiont]|nr:hypothetical protein D1AOALGA4SA_2365 [Olavius algarvensis Delta 1 endosymbiont]